MLAAASPSEQKEMHAAITGSLRTELAKLSSTEHAAMVATQAEQVVAHAARIEELTARHATELSTMVAADDAVVATDEEASAKMQLAANLDAIRAEHSDALVQLHAEVDRVRASAGAASFAQGEGEVREAIAAAIAMTQASARGELSACKAQLRLRVLVTASEEESAARVVAARAEMVHQRRTLRRLDDDAQQTLRDARRTLSQRSVKSTNAQVREAIRGTIEPLEGLLDRLSRENERSASTVSLLAALTEEAETCATELAKECLLLRREEVELVADVARRCNVDCALIAQSEAELVAALEEHTQTTDARPRVI